MSWDKPRLSIRRATVSVLVFLLALIGSAPAAAQSTAWTIEVGTSATTISDDLKLLTAAPAPDGKGILGLTQDERDIYFFPWQGDPRKLDLGTEGFQRGASLDTAHDRLIFAGYGRTLDRIYDKNLALVKLLPQRLHSAYSRSLLGSRYFAIGGPVIAAEGETAQWEDRKWVRSRVRADCRIFSVDLDDPDLVQKPAFCTDDLSSPTGMGLQDGELLPSLDGMKMYAVVEALPDLYVLDANGEAIRKASYREDGEDFPKLTPAQEKMQYASPEAALAVRSSFPWFVGMLRFEDKVGLLFRVVEGKEARFVIDLFDANGEKLANDLPLGIPLQGYHDQLKPLNLPDGRVMMLARERGPRGEIRSNRFFELTLHPSSTDEAKTTGSVLRFELLDAASGEPIETTRAILRHGKRTKHRDLEAVSEGRYVVRDFPAIPLRLTLEADGYLAIETEIDLRDELDLGVLLLDPGASVSATLLDAAAGEPVIGAEIVAVRRHAWGKLVADHFGFHHTAETDMQGRFSLHGLEAGPVCLRVEHPDLPRTALIANNIEESEHRDLGTLLLGRSVNIAGRITDGEGEPIAAEVEIRAGGLHDPCVRLRSVVEDDGVFDFTNVAAGVYHLAVRQKHQIIATQVIDLTDSKDRTDLGDVRTAVRSMSARILRDGVDIESGLVTFEPAVDVASVAPVFIKDPASPTGQTVISDFSARVTLLPDGDGIFSANGYLPPGEVLLTFYADDGMLYREVIEAPRQGAIRLQAEFSGIDVEGFLHDENGTPVGAVAVDLTTVTSTGRQIAVRTTSSDSEGRFLFPDVPPSLFHVRARSGDLRVDQPLQVGIDPPAPLYLRMSDDHSRALTADLVSPDGATIRGVVLLVGEDGMRRIRTGTGQVRFEGLAPGRYQAIAYARGGLTTSEPLDLLHDSEHVVALESSRLRKVDVLVDEKYAGVDAVIKTSEGFPVNSLLRFIAMPPRVEIDGTIELPRLAEASTWQVALGSGTDASLQSFEARPAVNLRTGL